LEQIHDGTIAQRWRVLGRRLPPCCLAVHGEISGHRRVKRVHDFLVEAIQETMTDRQALAPG
jgi:hypothetical protein